MTARLLDVIFKKIILLVSEITKGIKVSVESKFEPAHSSVAHRKYVHSYTIKIENTSLVTVQLMRRHWKITDADLNVKEVRGEGVVGQKPILEPGASHIYSSWCPIRTEIGNMKGTYQMRREDNSTFKVRVPQFVLCASSKLN